MVQRSLYRRPTGAVQEMALSAAVLLVAAMVGASHAACPLGASLADREDVFLGLPRYQNKTAADKLAILTDRLEATRGRQAGYPILARGLETLFGTYDRYREIYEFASDEMAHGSHKFVHPKGVHARVRWSPGEHNYTGLWAQENMTGLMRLTEGVASLLSPAAIFGSTSANPRRVKIGVGLKFLRSKMRSANLLFCKVDGWSRRSALAANFSTSGPTLAESGNNIVVQHKFLDSFPEQTGWPTKVGVSDMALHTEAGEPVDRPNTPFLIMLEPYPEVQALDELIQPAGPGVERWQDVMIDELKADDRLFRVLAVNHPGAEPHEIGSLWLVEGLFRSKWGDDRLKFQHQDFNQDLALNPNWKNESDMWNSGLGFKTDTETMSQWPVMRLFQPCAALATGGLVMVLAVAVTAASGQLGNQTLDGRRSEAPSSQLQHAIHGTLSDLTESNNCRILSSSVRERDMEVKLQCDTAMDAGRSILTLEQSRSELGSIGMLGSVGVSVAIESIYAGASNSGTNEDDGSRLTLMVLVGVAAGLVVLVGLVVAAALLYMSRSLSTNMNLDADVVAPGPARRSDPRDAVGIRIESNPLGKHGTCT